jgi:hypothetical protein
MADRYTVWFYNVNRNGELERAYDVFTGTRYQCYKYRNSRPFAWQYRVFKCKW